LSATLTFAFWADETVPALATKDPLVNPAAIDTDIGTVSRELLLVITTTAPREPAGFVKEIVHVVFVREVTATGAHVRLDTIICVVSDSVADCVVPPSVALSVALWLDESVLVVIGKLAAVAPAGMDMDGGALRLMVSLAMDTLTALALGLLSTAVQLEAAIGPRMDGAHTRPLTTTCVVRLTVKLAVEPLSLAVTIAV
jgi:hypothetical protein